MYGFAIVAQASCENRSGMSEHGACCRNFRLAKLLPPFLARAGPFKPLSKPVQNYRKWFAASVIERMSLDPDWLDKAIRIVEKQIQEMNKKHSGKERTEMSLVL